MNGIDAKISENKIQLFAASQETWRSQRAAAGAAGAARQKKLDEEMKANRDQAFELEKSGNLPPGMSATQYRMQLDLGSAVKLGVMDSKRATSMGWDPSIGSIGGKKDTTVTMPDGSTWKANSAAEAKEIADDATTYRNFDSKAQRVSELRKSSAAFIPGTNANAELRSLAEGIALDYSKAHVGRFNEEELKSIRDNILSNLTQRDLANDVGIGSGDRGDAVLNQMRTELGNNLYGRMKAQGTQISGASSSGPQLQLQPPTK